MSKTECNNVRALKRGTPLCKVFADLVEEFCLDDWVGGAGRLIVLIPSDIKKQIAGIKKDVDKRDYLQSLLVKVGKEGMQTHRSDFLIKRASNSYRTAKFDPKEKKHVERKLTVSDKGIVSCDGKDYVNANLPSKDYKLFLAFTEAGKKGSKGGKMTGGGIFTKSVDSQLSDSRSKPSKHQKIISLGTYALTHRSSKAKGLANLNARLNHQLGQSGFASLNDRDENQVLVTILLLRTLYRMGDDQVTQILSEVSGKKISSDEMKSMTGNGGQQFGQQHDGIVAYLKICLGDGLDSDMAEGVARSAITSEDSSYPYQSMASLFTGKDQSNISPPPSGF